jgi:hypothetical protein
VNPILLSDTDDAVSTTDDHITLNVSAAAAPSTSRTAQLNSRSMINNNLNDLDHEEKEEEVIT